MEITVLMATYQGEPYIRQQLDSILAQTVPVGLMISDDGSEDGTRKILEEYGRGAEADQARKACPGVPACRRQLFLAAVPGRPGGMSLCTAQ